MLKIVKKNEPILVNRLNVCIYSAPGLGKTTLGYTAERPLLLDFDHGSYRAGNRGDTVEIGKWSDVASITEADLGNYQTIVVDTCGRALDLLTQDIIAQEPKLGRGLALTLQGFGQLKSRFQAWLKMLNLLGKDCVLLAHLDEQRNGDDVIERLDIQGSSKAEIYKQSDAMGRIVLQGQERYIDFSPRQFAFGKNPCNLPVIPFPSSAVASDTLAKIIAGIKTSLNQLSREQQAAQQLIDEWKVFLVELKAENIEDFNGSLGELKKTPLAVRNLAKTRAQELGFTWNKSKGIFEVTHAAAS